MLLTSMRHFCYSSSCVKYVTHFLAPFLLLIFLRQIYLYILTAIYVSHFLASNMLLILLRQIWSSSSCAIYVTHFHAPFMLVYYYLIYVIRLLCVKYFIHLLAPIMPLTFLRQLYHSLSYAIFAYGLLPLFMLLVFYAPIILLIALRQICFCAIYVDASNMPVHPCVKYVIQ